MRFNTISASNENQRCCIGCGTHFTTTPGQNTLIKTSEHLWFRVKRFARCVQRSMCRSDGNELKLEPLISHHKQD